jgi:hypothetical protein
MNTASNSAQKRRQDVVIGVLMAGDEAKGHQIKRGQRDLATGVATRRIAIDQQREHLCVWFGISSTSEETRF